MGEIMKTKYKYIHFVKVTDKRKTTVWSCRNNRSEEELGEVRWYPGWRQYCYMPTAKGIYSVSCFEDICHFIAQLANERLQ